LSADSDLKWSDAAAKFAQSRNDIGVAVADLNLMSHQTDLAATFVTYSKAVDQVAADGAKVKNQLDDMEKNSNDYIKQWEGEVAQFNNDDLRKAVGEYQKKHGMPKAQKLIPELIGGPIQQVRPQDIPAMIFKVQAATEAPIEKVEPKFTPVTTAEPPAEEKKPEPKPAEATRHQVNDAINDYARKYDGSLDPTAMIATRAALPPMNLAFAGWTVVGAISQIGDRLQ